MVSLSRSRFSGTAELASCAEDWVLQSSPQARELGRSGYGFAVQR